MNWYSTISCMPNNQATKRYTRRMMVAMSLYILALFAAIYLLRHFHPAQPLAIALSILPSIPLVGVLVVVGLYLRDEKDEFQRTIMLESMLWALACILAITSVWGLLEMIVAVPHLPVFYIFPGFWFLFGLCTPLVRMRYRGSASDE